MTVDTRLIELRALEAKLKASAPGSSGAGGGSSGGGDDVWKKGIDDQLRRNADDIRALLRGIIAAGLVVVGMIVGLYAYVGSKTDSLASQIGTVRVEQAQVRGDVREMEAIVNGKLDRLAYRRTK